MHIRLFVCSLLSLATAGLLTIGFGARAYGHDLRILSGITGNTGNVAEDEILFSERPVDGVRIIREKDYKKRPAHYLSSNLYTSLATGRETGNKYVSFDFQVTPDGGPEPHTHRNEWETFFVVEGEVTFTVGVEPNPPFAFIEEVIPAGTVVYGSQGPVHGFKNHSGQPARIFSFCMPAGLEVFFSTSGERVQDFKVPIPPISQEEILRTAFWAEQRGDALHFGPPPVLPPGTPDEQISSISDPTRPKFVGPFGETRVSLLSPAEVGNITGATAFCGPGPKGRPGGTVQYSFFSLPESSGKNFPAAVSSQNIEVFYTLDGSLSFQFDGQTVTVPPLTFVEIYPGVLFSIANGGAGPAESLAISSIAPVCPPPPF